MNMTTIRHFRRSAGAVGLVGIMVATAARGGDDRTQAHPTTQGDRVSRLEAMLDTYRQKVEDLEHQVQAASQQDVDQARSEVLKKQIREILSEDSFRESLMPSTLNAGYDSGFFIKSSDNNFSMKFNGAMQFRWAHYATQSRNRYTQPRLQRDDRTGFDLTRVRLWVSGNAWSPDLTYYLHLGSDASGRYDTGLYYAWVNYRFVDELQVKAGIFDLASTRHTLNDDFAQHFIDRPLFDAVFGLGTGLGVRFWGQAFNKRAEWFLDVVNSTADGENVALGRTISTDPAELDSNPAIIGSAMWHVLGENIPNDFLAESDLEFHQSPALDLGVHYAFNDDQGDVATTRLPFPLRSGPGTGGFGLTNTNGTQFHQFGAHACAKWRGFSLMSEYVLRVVDPRRAFRRPFTPLSLLTGEQSTVAQHGAVVSVGYFLPIPGLEKKLEVVGRVGGISALAEGREGAWEYGAGLNYYIKGQNVKLQADVSKIYEAPISSAYTTLANVNDDALVFRVQLQVGF